jgi:hypothetical protein
MVKPISTMRNTMRPVVRRSRRGVALLATVVLTVIAAGAAMVIVSLTLDSTRSDATRIDRYDAYSAIRSAQRGFENELASAPFFYYTEVYALERARVCTAGDNRVVQPGTPWPSECGTQWSYQQADAPGAVRLEIEPSNIDEPNLNVKAISLVGRSVIAMQWSYAPDSAGRYSLASSSDLDLNQLPHGAGSELTGELYSDGVLTLPSFAIIGGRGVVSARDGYLGAPETSPYSENPVRFFGPTEDLSGNVPVYPIRELHPISGTASGMNAMFATSVEIACGTGTPVSVNGAATSLCLSPGGTVIGADLNPLVLPATATRFMLIFSQASDRSVDVYWSDRSDSAPSTCGGGCNLSSSSQASITAGEHPGAASYWSSVGTLLLPYHGIIHSSIDTQIGMCGSNFASTASACTSWNTTAGMEVRANVSVLVGSLLEPADVYLGGDIFVADTASFGVVASGRILLPYWAASTDEVQHLEGSYVGLAIGGYSAGVETYPAVNSSGSNTRDALLLEGGFTGNGIDTSFPLYDSIQIVGRARHWRTPPPLFLSPTGSWRLMSSTRVSAAENCGTSDCSGF